MDRAQRVHEKNSVTCLVMFTLRVMIIKMSKIVFVFSADDSKKLVTVWVKYIDASEISYLGLLENHLDSWVLSYH